MGVSAGVLGATGWTGAELMRILAAHGGVEVLWVTSERYKGSPLTDAFPHLSGLYELRCDSVSAFDGLAEVDVVFACLPPRASAHFVPRALGRGFKVIDLSPAHRMDALHPPRGRDGAHAAVYGLTEYNRARLRAAPLVANPGCYATAALLGALPIVEGALAAPGARVVVDAKGAVSGAGRAPVSGVMYPEAAGSVGAVAVDVGEGAEDTPAGQAGEIETALGAEAAVVTLVAHRVPFDRGLYATLYIPLRSGVGEDDVREALCRRYGGERFVHVMPAGSMPELKWVRGSNDAHLGFFVDRGVCVLGVALDNLVKGAAGQAVQNMNLMFGMDEGRGLCGAALYP